MTLIEKLITIFPKTKMQKKGVPLNMCPSDLGYKDKCTHQDCKKCWAQKIECIETKPDKNILLITKLKKEFPGVKLMKDKTPNFCPENLGYRSKCNGDCHKCWYTKKYKQERN